MTESNTNEQSAGTAAADTTGTLMTGAEANPAFFMQPKITGYRQLTKAEVDLMNEGKALAEQCGAYINKLRNFVPEDTAGVNPGSTLDQRWISIGSTDLQRGFMAVIRGIAQPTTF